MSLREFLKNMLATLLYILILINNRSLYYFSFSVIIPHPIIEHPRYTPDPKPVIRQTPPTTIQEPPRPTPTRPPRRVVIAMYNYEARDSQDVSFKKGDRMEVIDDTEGDWLNVMHLITKEHGYIPGNFVAPELSVESEE